MAQQKLSPEKYITTKARSLPYYECIVNADWQKSGMAEIMVAKKMPGGNYIIGSYLVDVFCIGLKDTWYQFNKIQSEYEDMVSNFKERFNSEIQNLKGNEVNNIIFGAIDYAEELGFKPHDDFKISEYILNPEMIDDGIDELEFGKNGQPLYISGPYDNTARILGILRRKVGEENFKYIVQGDLFE